LYRLQEIEGASQPRLGLNEVENANIIKIYPSNQSFDFRMVALAVLIVLIVASAIGMIRRHRSHRHETFDSVQFSGCS
jgi:hypothetical protein